jgi:peptidoglycan/LPS O-acetylase OafA/YrhL
VSAYDAAEWSDLFVATAGASAALAGLVFVAVSINVERILKIKGLPERSLETVLLLLSVVVVSIIGLIPGQSTTALGVELLAVGLLFAAVIAALSDQALPPGAEPRRWLLSRMLVRGLGTLPFVIGAISLIAETGGGLYWTVAGIVFAIAGAVANAWVLMVEILR